MNGLRDQSGFTIAEMLMSMAVSLVILTAILAMTTVATHSQDRVASRVAANQRARPALVNLLDRLHSACVAPGIAPILAGSSSSTIQFLSQPGSAVSPTPSKYVVALSGTQLTEQRFAPTGGAPPTWTFSGVPSSTRQLLTGVGPAKVGGTTVPLFRYYAYNGGQVSTTPLPTPLSAGNAALAVQVDIAMAVSPGGGPVADANTPITLTDSATLRLEPASEDSSEVNLPCV